VQAFDAATRETLWTAVLRHARETAAAEPAEKSPFVTP